MANPEDVLTFPLGNEVPSYLRPTFSREHLRHTGVVPFTRWYPGGSCTFIGASALAINTIYAVPFMSGRTGSLTDIRFEVTLGGAVGSVARVGVYDSTGIGNIYPNNRIVDGGEQNTNIVGVKNTAVVGVTLNPGALYWFCYICGVSAPTIRTYAGSSLPFEVSVIGLPSTLGASDNSLSGALAYGALPVTFPVGFTPGNIAAPPLIAVQITT